MDGEMFDKQKKLQYLLELGIILKGKIRCLGNCPEMRSCVDGDVWI